MKLKEYAKKLYSIDLLKKAISEKKWWVIGGAIVYGIPATYRAITRNPMIFPPIESGNAYIPSNLYEKLVVNFVAPGGVGAVIGESYLEKLYGKATGLKKYLYRVVGSVSLTGLWASLQYIGYLVCDTLKYSWPSGGNPFESPNVYPFNLFIAVSLAPFLPYFIDGVKRVYKKLKKA